MRKADTYATCTNCKWFVEVVGLGRPHPLRCGRQAFTHGPNERGMMDLLPERRWCIHYKPEDGVERMPPLDGMEGA